MPLLQATAPDAPIFKAKAASKASMRGPEAKSGARTASATAATVVLVDGVQAVGQGAIARLSIHAFGDRRQAPHFFRSAISSPLTMRRGALSRV